ncbi:MAG: phosphatidylglycerophosphatase A [Thermoanaerobaculum sp.]|nr:phosphatidylglycerophosphatase A [Thermoanaerobaculum sp.]MDW7967920.1 phosphatidylglycerophosphatase A [Thermoanaerobaculum sp.]
MSWWARALATVGFLAEVLPAPGTTVGSLAGLALFLLVPAPDLSLALGVVLTAAAPWLCGREALRRGERDPGAVVLDEVVGQWWTLQLSAWVGVPPTPVWLAVNFVFFRLFDVLKPPPVRQAERLPGGVGIVADDLAAGVLAAGSTALAFLASG